MTKIENSFLLQTPVHEDGRGKFEIFWEQELLTAAGISFRPTNAHHSYNTKSGTLRGMHFQKSPHGQAKLVSCVSGSVFDVMVDLRKDSPTFGQWEAHQLSAHSGKATYIPAGCAHGFLTLEDHSTVAYLIEGEYRPSAGGVLNWRDSKVAIPWPSEPAVISDLDANAPEWTQCEF